MSKSVRKRGYRDQKSKYKNDLRVFNGRFEYIVTLELLHDLGIKKPKSRNPAGDYLMNTDQFCHAIMDKLENRVINYGKH